MELRCTWWAGLLRQAIRFARQPAAPRSESFGSNGVAAVGKGAGLFALEWNFVPKWSYTDLKVSFKLWADLSTK